MRFHVIFRTVAFALATGALLLGAACATHHSRLPFQYDEAGIPHATKRVEQHPQRDFFHHFVRTAYYKVTPNEQFKRYLSAEQQNIIKQWGLPDWQRKPFRSLSNERVDEWLYLDKGRVFQFVGGKNIFEGPLTDYEQVLLGRGYPDRAIQVRDRSTIQDVNLDIFVYYNVFTPRAEEIHFYDGMITQAQGGL